MHLKYAFMSFSAPQASLDELLAIARRYGYDGIEPRVSAGHSHGIEPSTPGTMRKLIRQKALDASVALCCIATSIRFANAKETAEQLQMARACIDLAADLGVPRLRVFGGSVPQTVSREEAIGTVANSLKQIATQAEQRNVVVCMETHDDWCNPLDVAEVMKQVNHPAIGVNWDIMHPVRQASVTMDQAFTILKPWIRHVHFHDGIFKPDLVLKPVGQGEVDHHRAVQLLKAMDYDGYLSGEWIGWEPPDVHLPRELATMRTYEEAVQE